MNEQDLPIDIHVGKLVEWLISRRHVKREWPENIRAIREKINKAIQDMPEHPEVTRLLSGTYINYFHCQRIVEILKETEKDSKNILGWYGSQRMKDWQEVVRLYEKDNVYLAEAAQLLVRNVNYEVPGIKRQITKGIQIQKDCDARQEELVKGIAAAKKKYLKNCKQIGIAGDDVKAELIGLLSTLPEEFASVVKESQGLETARQLYFDFLTFTVPEHHTNCLPLLKFIMEHGNVTTYEWLYGEAPCSVEEPQIIVASQKDSNTDTGEIDFGSGAIDFGDIKVGEEGGEAIDFGDDLATGEIDWGNLGGESQPSIDWGVGEDEDAVTTEITVEDSGVGGGVARGSEALSILHNQTTRTQFIDELHELEGFLKQRGCELEGDKAVFSFNQFSSAPTTVQDHSTAQVTQMLDQAKKVLDLLSTTKMHHLFLIASSPRYVDRLAESLQSKLAVGDKLADTQVTVQQRKEDTAEEQRSLTPQLKLIIERTRELQQHIAQDISKKYKNRPVNIMGGHLTEHI